MLKIRKAIKMMEFKTLLTYLNWNYGFSYKNQFEVYIEVQIVGIDGCFLYRRLYIAIYIFHLLNVV